MNSGRTYYTHPETGTRWYHDEDTGQDHPVTPAWDQRDGDQEHEA